MTNEMKKINAVLVVNAECRGSGSDWYKTVNGITKSVLAEITKLEKIHGELAILVKSHTKYQGQRYKRVVIRNGYKNHRQIVDSDYDIVALAGIWA